jgi:hypothetical protein
MLIGVTLLNLFLFFFLFLLLKGKKKKSIWQWPLVLNQQNATEHLIKRKDILFLVVITTII